MTVLTGVPGLQGRLSTDDRDLDAAAGDFGNLVHRRPRAVLHPRGAADVAAVVRYGREHAVPVVPRGAGHTVDGQAQVRDGIVVDMAALADVATPGPDRVSAGAGAPWSAVADATLAAGLIPPVMVDHLGLSVGGTLSAGGISGTSHQHGCVADNVHDLDVVTPDGELITCSPTRHRDLFDAVRATQGEHGIIVRATLALTAADHSARRYLLPYHDLGTFLADQRLLIADRRFGHVGGQVVLAPGEGWRYILEAVATFTAPAGPDDQALLDGLRYDRGAEQIATTPLRGFLDRIAPVEAHLRRTGAWQYPHPRCTVMLPGAHAEAIVAETISTLTADTLGADLGGNLLLYPIPTRQLGAPHMPKAQDPVTVVFGVQRTAPPDSPELVAQMQRGNADLRARAQKAGGAVYTYPTAHHQMRNP